ncbi:hypothetical protein ACS0TY_015013 [Phlomoides rotata]
MHMVFVWPILFTILVLLYFTRPLLSIALLDQSFLVLNLGFFLTVVYGVYYVGGSALAYHLGFSLAWRKHLEKIWWTKLDEHLRNIR